MKRKASPCAVLKTTSSLTRLLAQVIFLDDGKDKIDGKVKLLRETLKIQHKEVHCVYFSAMCRLTTV